MSSSREFGSLSRKFIKSDKKFSDSEKLEALREYLKENVEPDFLS